MGSDKDQACDFRFNQIFRFGDPIQVFGPITDTGIFIALQDNRLIWVRHDDVTNQVVVVYSPFDQVSVQRI